MTNQPLDPKATLLEALNGKSAKQRAALRDDAGADGMKLPADGETLIATHQYDRLGEPSTVHFDGTIEHHSPGVGPGSPATIPGSTPTTASRSSGSICSCRSATRSSTRIRRGSSTATSSPRMCS